MKKTVKPKKQRKRAKNIALRRGTGTHLSKNLKKKYKVRTVGLRVGDGVKVLRGKYKGKTGKVEEIKLKRQLVYIEGIRVQKADGTKAKVGIQKSNLMITSLEMKDKLRKIKIERNITKPKGEKK